MLILKIIIDGKVISLASLKHAVCLYTMSHDVERRVESIVANVLGA